jgi:hypothetical protein
MQLQLRSDRLVAVAGLLSCAWVVDSVLWAIIIKAFTPPPMFTYIKLCSAALNKAHLW